ncbi:hypothetical protein ACFU99_35990 [Streptomyces sp. NPDC057654]|uniref:hypothetical protein n=1 Tax=Streptomyces sp. NPDC057654 TaxID=3346196 RepID=UPI003675FF7F
MPRRSRSRSARVLKGATMIEIPEQRPRRGRRGRVVVVVPEHRDHRPLFAPAAVALCAIPATALVHAVAWWAGLVLALSAVVPVVGALAGWLRVRDAAAGAMALLWSGLAVAFGPLTGPLWVLWALSAAVCQAVWLLPRPSR